MADTELTADQKAERDKEIKAGYQHAQRVLREKYRDEFVALQQEFLKAKGIEWSPAPTAAEKKRQALKELLDSDPSLKAELVAEIRGTTSAG